jgi:hypothetical protein
MRARPVLATAGTAAALLLCAAFVASFLFGLRGEPARGDARTTAATLQDAGASLGRVEVLNASGRAGLARAATDRLRGAGFDVVYFGNASREAGDSSVVVARVAADAVARAAARQLGIARVRTDVDTALFLDATIIIGRDWAAAVPDAGAEPAREGLLSRIGRWVTPGR